MKSVGVVGLGNWGTALANHLASKGIDVLGWSIENEIVESINSTRRNCRFLSHALLSENLRATTKLPEVVALKTLILALPSAVFSSVVPDMDISADTIVVSAIKGIDGATLLTPLQYFQTHGAPCAGLAVLSGPSFARDIVLHRPSGVVAASLDEAIARYTAELFRADWMKVYISTDPLGVELGGSVKNVIALAAGVCDGLELGDSARAGLITRGLAEMMRLASAMGADIRTLSGLAGLGDLVMTASCDTSRNRTVGLRLGRGERLEDILRTLGSVAEGVETTPHVLKLARKYQVEMPITELVFKLLNKEITPQECVRELLSRPMKREWE